jgi:hypothetical protein
LAAAVMERYLLETPRGVTLGLLISGAEEAGLFGAQAFVTSDLAPNPQAVLINLDMVGIGSRIGYVSRAGRLKPRMTDADLNTMIRTFQPRALAIDYRYRGSDFIPFLQRGYRAISLEATDRGEVPFTYHQAIDTEEHIQSSDLEYLGELVYSLLNHSILTIRDH